MTRADMMGGLADIMLPPAEQEPGEFERRWNVASDRRMPVAEAYQMGQLAGMDAYNEVDPLTAYGGYDKHRAALQRLEAAPDLGGPLIPSGPQVSAGHPAVNRAVDVASELGAGVVIPQSLSPLDIGLSVAGGPVGGKLLRGGAAALGALFEPDEAEAGALSKAGKVLLGGKPGGPHPGGIHVYHSSPHDFDKFDWSKLRTGEGANVYGSGFYFAENPKVSGQGGEYWNQFLHKFPKEDMRSAEWLKQHGFDRDAAATSLQADMTEAADHLKHARYTDPLMREADQAHWQARLAQLQKRHDALTSGQPIGPRTYEVNINARPELMLDWDKPVGKQPEVLEKIREGFPYYPFKPEETGQSVYTGFVGFPYAGGKSRDEAKQIISERLGDAGIPGIRYLDQGSRQHAADIENARKVAQQMKGRDYGAWGEELAALEAKPLSYNYVVTDPSKLDILAKYGIVGTAGGGMAALAAQDRYQQ